MKHFGPTYIDFDEYPSYCGRNSEIFEEMLMKLFGVSMVIHILQENRKVSHGVHEESCGMTKTCFPDAKQKKSQKNVLCKECTYVQKYINENDENFDSAEDNEPTFSS